MGRLSQTVRKLFDRRLVVFIVTGILATLVYAVAAAVLVGWAGWSQVPAAFAAFIISFFVSYSGNTFLGFQQAPGVRNFRRFLIVSLAGLVLTTLTTWSGELLNVNYLVTIAIVSLALPAMSFIAHLLWTYQVDAAPANGQVSSPKNHSGSAP